MKRTKKSPTWFIPCLLLLLTTSCKKNDNATATVEPSLDITTANIAGTYKLTESVKSDGTTNTDLYASLAACEKDDTYTYTASGNYARADNATVCTPTKAENGTYAISNTIVTYYIGGNSFVETIEKITATKLYTSSSYSLGTTKYSFKTTYTRQ